MKRYIFDIETNGLLTDATKVHCIVMYDIDKGELLHLSNEAAVKKLTKADLIVGHNIIKFDIPVLKKFYNFKPRGKAFDTIIATRLLFPDIRDSDFKRKDFPPKLIGRHSLESWGHRIGTYKAHIETDWSEFTAEMLAYCKQDVLVNSGLYNAIEKKGYSQAAMDLEHEVASIIFRQEQHGFMFDLNKATKLFSTLNARRFEIEDELQELFQPIIKETPFTPKVNNKSRGYVKGEVFIKKETVTFNPSSRQHVAERFKDAYGWTPKEFTPDGKPKVDDVVLSKLNYPAAKLLAEHFLLDKRIAQLATGNQAWLKLETGGKLHGTCNTNSTVTARASHAYPNLAQVPSIHAPYGKECRELFTVPTGKKLVGIDVSGLEVRMLAHYMARFDDGEYTKVVLEGDIHTETQTLAGLDSRDLAKRFYYCFLYGGGVKKIAEVTGKTVKEAGQVKKRFLNNLPALNKLIEQVQSTSAKGYLKGIDGRQIKVRSPHSALNTLLQSAGAIVCKKWLVEFDRLIKPYTDVQQVVWVHDEIQVQVNAEWADIIGDKAVEAITNVGKELNLRIPLTGEFKIGNNWSETH